MAGTQYFEKPSNLRQFNLNERLEPPPAPQPVSPRMSKKVRVLTNVDDGEVKYVTGQRYAIFRAHPGESKTLPEPAQGAH
jgi:hypothetical protein